ncbi:MAG: hypothetical protein ACYCVD_04110 [Desulfitobacteriaceae bacterium]
MKEVITKYECPVCSKQYETKEDAKKCFIPVQERFKVGDIVDMGTFRPIRVTHSDSQFRAAITGEYVAELDIARGVKPKTGTDARGCFIGPCICRAKRFDLKKAKEIVRKLKTKLNAAEKFLEMVKAMGVVEK